MGPGFCVRTFSVSFVSQEEPRRGEGRTDVDDCSMFLINYGQATSIRHGTRSKVFDIEPERDARCRTEACGYIRVAMIRARLSTTQGESVVVDETDG